MFLKHYFKASTQSLKEEGALENHASVFETHTNMKMQWFFFFGIQFLLLLKNTPNFKVKRKHGYVEECMILKYVNPGRKGKIQEFTTTVSFFFGRNVYPLCIGQVFAHSYV